MTGPQIGNFTSANRCYCKNVTALFTSMEHWAKRLFVGFLKARKFYLFIFPPTRQKYACRDLLTVNYTECGLSCQKYFKEKQDMNPASDLSCSYACRSACNFMTSMIMDLAAALNRVPFCTSSLVISLIVF